MYRCILVNRSVITRIALYPSDSGNSPTKSMAISSQEWLPVGIGISLVCRECRSAFAFWHGTHPATYDATSSCHLCHMKFLLTSSCVRALLQWPATLLS